MSNQSDSPNGRVKRPPLTRKVPVRNWSTLFGPPPVDAARARANTNPSVAANEQTPASTTDGDGVVEGVQLGYKVVEQHLKQAEHFARVLYAPFSDKGDGGPNLEGMTERMFRHANDLASAWMEIVRSLDGSTRGRKEAGAGPFQATPGSTDASSSGAPFPTPATTAVGTGGTFVSIEVEAHRPFRATADLRPGAHGKNLLAHDLRSGKGDGPRLEGVKVSTNAIEGTICISLTIPDHLPPQTYSGVIVDAATDLPQGMLAVRVDE